MFKKCVVLSFFLVFVTISSAISDDAIFSFGSGKIKVRLYTDYFCGPCSSIEDQIEPIIKELVEKNVINLTFIDVPAHRYTPFYAAYFLYVLNEDKSFNRAIITRSLLFKAAKEKIIDKDQLEQFLQKNGVKFKPVDPRAYFESYNYFLTEDKIRSTPTCVVIKPEKKDTYIGLLDYLKTLFLRVTKPEKKDTYKSEKKDTYIGSKEVVEGLKNLSTREK